MRRIARGIQKFVVENPEPFIVNVKFKNEPESINKPLSTITAVNSKYLIAPYLAAYHSETRNGEVRGLKLTEPIHTIDGSNRFALVSAFISKYYEGTYKGAGSDLKEPLHTVTGKNHNALVTAFISKMYKTGIGQSMDEPLHTITTSPGHFAEVQAFLIKYYGAGDGQNLNEPLHTIPTKDRFGLVVIKGELYRIVDIGMRMLQPHELFAAQGFPDDYIIDRDYTGKSYPKSEQVARCGNAVPPLFSKVLVEANLPEYCELPLEREA